MHKNPQNAKETGPRRNTIPMFSRKEMDNLKQLNGTAEEPYASPQPATREPAAAAVVEPDRRAGRTSPPPPPPPPPQAAAPAPLPAHPAAQSQANSVNVPLFQPPNERGAVQMAVCKQISFMYGGGGGRGRRGSNATEAGGSAASHGNYAVSIHVYDLSNGLLKKTSSSLLGTNIAGMYHSGIVCYGMEFFFEGGIAVDKAGHTRFGPKFQTILLGTTKKTVSEFMRWITKREEESYQLWHYHLTKLNCHHFTNEAASWLLGTRDAVPRFIFTSVEDLLKCPIADLGARFMQRTHCGVQYLVAKSLLDRAQERIKSIGMMNACAESTGVGVIPPPTVVLFRINSYKRSAAAIHALTSYLPGIFEPGKLRDAAMETIDAIAKTIREAEGELLQPEFVLSYLSLVTAALSVTPLSLWGPILDGLRVAMLCKVVLIPMVSSGTLIAQLMRGIRDYRWLAPDGRLALLRVVCNLSSGPSGAMLYLNVPRRDAWVSLVGMAFFDESPAVVYTGATLALNIMISYVTIAQPSLSKELKKHMDQHPLYRLSTLMLYLLKQVPSTERIPEPTVNFCLLAIFFFASSCTVALDMVNEHPFNVEYLKLLNFCTTNESRALLCMLYSLTMLYGQV